MRFRHCVGSKRVQTQVVVAFLKSEAECVDSVLPTVISVVLALNAGQVLFTVFLELRQAFDLPHEKVIQCIKLRRALRGFNLLVRAENRASPAIAIVIGENVAYQVVDVRQPPERSTGNEQISQPLSFKAINHR